MIRFYFFCLLSFLFFSCKNEVKDNPELKYNADNTIIINLPRTVRLNEIVNGKLKYLSPLDTIRLSGEGDRFTFFYLTTDTISYHDLESVKNSANYEAFVKEKDSFLIPYECRFTKLGINYFSGIVKDQIILDNYYDDGKSRIITKHTKFSGEVMVVK